MNYTELDAKMQGRNHESRKYENNTYFKRRGDNIAMLYHETDVATFFPNGDIKLDSGGWHTKSTKERMTWALASSPFTIIQNKGIWYLMPKGRWDLKPTIRYQDGITIKADGIIEGGLTETPNREKADKILKAKVKKYAELCASQLPLDQPSGGDCWFCAMVDEKGVSWGDSAHDTDHIDKHIKENYVVPSLVYQALKENYNAPMAMWETFKGTGVKDDSDREFGKMAVKKAVYRFIMKRKGYAI